MPTPNLPPGFDFTDPDIYAERLPIDELAEMRRVAPIWWNEQPIRHRRLRRRRLLGGDQAQGRQGGVAAQRRLLQPARRPPCRATRTAPRTTRSTPARFVLLNMDAPHHTHLRKIISRGFTPRAVERLRDDLNERAQNIVKAAAAEGSGDFVEQVSCELPLQAIAGLIGRAAGGPQEALRLVQPDGRRPGSRVRPSSTRPSRLDRTDHVRHAVGRAERPRSPAQDIVTKLIEADVEGHKLSDDEFGFFVDPAGGGGQRDHPQLDHPGHDGVHRLPRPVGAVQAGAPGNRRRRDRPVGHARSRRSSAPRWRTPNCPACRSRRASGW